MTTIAERTAPGVGKRMLLVGAAGLLLGGLAGGLVDRTLLTDQAIPVLVESTTPALTGAQTANVEGIRARNTAVRPATRVVNVEAVRVQNHTTRPATPAASIEAVRARNITVRPATLAANVEAVRTQNHTVQPAASAANVEAVRVQNHTA